MKMPKLSIKKDLAWECHTANQILSWSETTMLFRFYSGEPVLSLSLCKQVQQRLEGDTKALLTSDTSVP